MIGVIITGCFGRMGQEIVKLIGAEGFEDFQIIAGICTREQVNLPADFKTCQRLKDYIDKADVVIDFSVPASAMEFAKICAAYKKPFVCGTTGFTEEQEIELKKLAEQTPLFVSYNMSIGVAKFAQILKHASNMLAADYDVEILEKHHNKKADAPSGTAKMLAGVVAGTKKAKLPAAISTDRNHPRKEGEIGFASIRGGAIFGEHEVIFAGSTDIITLSHQALNRGQFAHGALSVARWLMGKKPGKAYGMEDFVYTPLI
ncbi:MAG: dihydrodipicolinate reductase [Candidatus Midichloriaceae bacterium]|jgi:4-hydroxy-tetrahydrodipicolinate reductase|nr:dihydrodipicolinate reductase [Candidatus Midichloriaceae bacterium]